MICKPCSAAGDLVAVARSNNTFKDERLVIVKDYAIPTDGNIVVSPLTKEVIRSVAHLYHGLCKDCDCQHIVDFEGKTIRG